MELSVMTDYTTFYKTPEKSLTPKYLLWFQNRKRTYTDYSAYYNRHVPAKIPSQSTDA